MRTRRLFKTLRLLVCVIGAAALLAEPLPALASAKIYWTSGEGKIQRVNPDGSGFKDVLTGLGGFIYGLALDVADCKMYWTDTLGRIQRANLDGSGVEDLISFTRVLASTYGIALDVSAGKMYWVDALGATIQRANLDGSGVEVLGPGLENLLHIALDLSAGKMYWTTCCSKAEKIQRANLDGSDVEDLVTGLVAPPTGIALDVSGGKMYWTDLFAGTIQRANLDGSAVEDLVTGFEAGTPSGIALNVAAGVMYWGDGLSEQLRRANLDGSGVEDVVAAGSTVEVAVLPPLRLGGCLLVDLKHLVDSCEPCDRGPKRSLLEPINEAIRQLDQGHARPAANALGEFVQWTEHWVETGQLPAAEGRRFIDLAAQIVGEL